jgi:hypothetical protein
MIQRSVTASTPCDGSMTRPPVMSKVDMPLILGARRASTSVREVCYRTATGAIRMACRVSIGETNVMHILPRSRRGTWLLAGAVWCAA